jgi:hypothetical protein
MKKIFLFIFLMSAIGLFAQNINKSKFRSPGKLYERHQEEQPADPAGKVLRTMNHQAPTGLKATNNVNPIAIGQSGNAWGFSYMRTTFLWAVNDINSISFIHRMVDPPGSGFLAYDVSKDGGTTWSLNNQVYDPTLPDGYNARYPQGVIYNPAGNTDPDNAYFSYFAPTLDGSNATTGSNWGGYAWGSKKLSDGATPTQTDYPSDDGFYQYLPSGFTLTQLGEAWVVDEEEQGGGEEYIYTGNLIVGHGIWNDEIEDFEYAWEHLPLEISPEAGINDVKVAFSPDGMTGWICALSDRIPALDQTWYHPILFKTTDGGQSWSSDPIEVQFGGEDGLDEIKQFISDDVLEDFYAPDPVPPRDEIPYYMGYHMDIAVDAWGNPHILGGVAICDLEAQSWWNYEGVFAMFHIYSDDQGETWKAFNIDYLKTFRGTYTGGGSEMNQYNRPQVATTEDGAIVFFSFLDTRIENVTENTDPDIFFREYIPEMEMHGEEVINVTTLSNAMWNARFGCMSHYVLAEVTDDGNYECTIPFVYEELTDFDISLPVQFWYIPDFIRSYVVTRIADRPEQSTIIASPNFPNPFRDETHFNINLLEESKVEVNIYNTAGQLIKIFDFGSLGNGPHRLTLKFENLNDGIYFYSLRAAETTVNGKMIVK